MGPGRLCVAVVYGWGQGTGRSLHLCCGLELGATDEAEGDGVARVEHVRQVVEDAAAQVAAQV